MSCECNCEPKANVEITLEATKRKRYNVSATKATYVSEHYDTVEEAVARMSELAHEDFSSVTLRDTDGEEIW